MGKCLVCLMYALVGGEDGSAYLLDASCSLGHDPINVRRVQPCLASD